MNKQHLLYYCKDCGKEISWRTGLYGAKRCIKCAGNKRKGKKFSKQTCNKIRESKMGKKRKPFTLKAKQNMRLVKLGKRNNNYKDGRTLTQYLCIDCHLPILWQTWAYGTKRCSKCSAKENGKKLKGKFIGKKASNYIHGKGYDPYTSAFTQKLKNEIRERDYFRCQNCGMTEKEHLNIHGKALEIHHIDYNKKNCKKENLITLCKQCNLRANKNRKYWKQFYKERILCRN